MWKSAIWKNVALALFAAVPVVAGTGWQVRNPIQHGHLAIFPVIGESAADSERYLTAYLTLDEGLAAGAVRVGELGSLQGRMVRSSTQAGTQAAQVNELVLVNNSDRPLLLIAGEIVSGGKQDRVVARDRIVPPHSAPVPLGVFCVEPGRWRGLSLEFASTKLMAHPQLRKQAVLAQDQGKVWAEVASKRQAMAAVVGGVAEGTPTSSYAVTAAARPVQARVSSDASAFLPQLPEDAVGMVVAVGGRILWADVFPHAALFRRYRTKLLQSYVVESYGADPFVASSKAPALEEVREFLRPIGGREQTREQTEVEPGLYRLMRSEAEGMVTYELEALQNGSRARLHFARMTK